MSNENSIDLSKIHIYIYSSRNKHRYYEDYIKSINKILNATIIFKIDKNIDIMNKNNIIIFVHSFPCVADLGIKLDNINNNLFFLNTEQLTDNSIFEYIKNISKNFNIIDYSKENIYIMNNSNIKNTIYFPYIYNPDEIYNFTKTEDICGISANNTPRRQNFLKLLYNNNVNINNITGWNRRRDKKLFKYKIILNISAQEDRNIFETMRCNRCLFNKMIIISEEKYKTELIDYANHILFAKFTDIPKLANEVLSNYEYYYKKLDLDNIDYTLNNHLISKEKLVWNCRNINK